MRWRHCVAVVGSFTAGESARIAMSTRIRSANIGSRSNIRSSPTTTAFRSATGSAPTGPPNTQELGALLDTVTYAGNDLDDEPVSLRDREQGIVLDPRNDT